MSPRKRIAVLGSTGSIGRSVLSVVESNPDAFQIVSLSALTSAELLAEQARRFGVTRVAIGEDAADAAVLGNDLEVGVGEEALVALASDPGTDLVVNALVGTAGLPVTAASVAAGKRLAIANKESLVMAGELVMRLAGQTGGELIPVDSEHSSIFRCLRGVAHGEVCGVVLTASGGPLRDTPLEEVRDADVAAVLSHPTWDMGEKITVDSATLVNKAMEVVEAMWLFDLPPERVDVVVHRESVVHSFVQLSDGSLLAHLGTPDMRVPIQYALFYPDAPGVSFDEFRPAEMGALNFGPVEHERYPCFELVLASAREGGTAPTTAVTADEVAVGAYLAGRIRFGDIATVIAGTLEAERSGPAEDLATVFKAERSARATATEIVDDIAGRSSRGPAGAAHKSGLSGV
ncbi:MAG: 1-deoxy-D-xylulose-5-phosphate reductoisomerase [Candidatus Eisenbacteria bacterium]